MLTANLLVIFYLTSSGVLSIFFFPEQVHIAWSSIDSSMTVTWASDYPTYGASVEYTPIDSPDTHVSTFAFKSYGTWTTFPNKAIPYILQRHLHTCTATMTNLVPGKFYKYRVGSNIYGWTSQFAFESKRDFVDNPLARFLVYGDLGIGQQINETMIRLTQEVNTYKYDAIIHNGDFAYDLDSYEGEYGDRFLRAIEPIASEVPYMVSEGNHEGGSTLPHYLYRFSMPGNSNNLWYSFNAGKAHFLSISTEFIFDNQPDLQAAQVAFIEEDLSTYDRSKYPWLIVFGHRPLYCSANMTAAEPGLGEWIPPVERHNQDCLMNASTVRANFEELWYKHKVDFVIQSHVHAYERLASVYQNQSVPCEYEDQFHCINAQAPVYVVTGVPGQQESYAPNSPTPLPFSMAQDDHLGYSRLTVFNETHLFWEQVRSETLEIVDYLWLMKENSVDLSN